MNNEEVIEMTDVRVSTQIVEFNEFESKLAEFKQKYQGVVYDLNDKKQDKQARSDKYAIGQIISALDERHREVKAPLLEKTKLLDGERKRIKDQLLGIQDGIKGQIEAHEELIRRKAAQLQSRVDEITRLSIFDYAPSSSMILERTSQLKATVIDDSFEDRQGDAALAKERAANSLEELLTSTLAREKQEREQEEARQEAERKRKAEELQRLEAEARARADREAAEAIAAAERRAKEAEERAERAKAEEAARIKAEQEAESKRIADEKAKRERDQAHRQAVIDTAVAGLMNFGLSQTAASAAIKAIATGNVQNVQINF